MVSPKIKVVFVGEAYGEQEAMFNHGFVGMSGHELARMANTAGLVEEAPYDDESGAPYSASRMVEYWNRSGIGITNVFNLRPPGNKIESFCTSKAETPPGYDKQPLSQGNYVKPEYFDELTRLREELLEWRPNLIVAFGNTAMWALANATGITKLRGTTLTGNYDFKILPTFHPAAVLRQWQHRPVVIADLMKAKRESEYPELRRPSRELWIEPTLDDLNAFWDTHIRPTVKARGSLCVDIETAHDMITCIGVATSPTASLCVPFVDRRKPQYHYWQDRADEIAAYRWLAKVMATTCVKISQNGMYDLQYMIPVGLCPRKWTADTMLLHHALQPEMRKSLDFLGSIYTDEVAWKLMRPRGRDIVEKRDD
jgi:uracil-DNA glycosylase